MKTNDFEDFLKKWYICGYKGTDDNAADAFDHWLSELSQDRLIELAGLAMKEAELRGSNRVAELMLTKVRNLVGGSHLSA